MIVSSRLLWIVEILKENRVSYHFNELAAEYMLTYGYMIDESTFIKEVKRLLPGNKLTVNEEGIELIQYYVPMFKIEEGLSIDEAIDRIDRSFRKAVQREFIKDQEYGYQHLVDLSGGLDSRMVTWVAHDLGYVRQTNFSYCKADYLDFKIASNIAKDLKHEFYFKQLDDFNWIYSIDDILRLNNGAALYCGITGGASFLSSFNQDKYGIEHTGMLGDVIISCFSSDEKHAMERPKFGKNQYSEILRFKFDEDMLDRYANQEMFDLYTRGFLGAMSTYPIRQNYFEVSSPFLDVDFMETCFSIPIKYRANHLVYLKWIEKYYKKASNYGWEKWAGVCPKEKMRLWRNGIFAVRKVKRSFRQLFGMKISDSMNPVDYWYSKDEKAQKFFIEYFRENINNICFSDSIKQDMNKMFEAGTVSEKAQVLTVLGIAKSYWPQ